jgi:mannose-6-phosphate isomerase-like protein (cupin superfamily)
VGEATVIRPGAGEIIGDAPERRVEILCEHDALHATWSRFGPRRDGADLHVHRRHTDLFYVLDGELTVRLGPEGRGVAAPAGTLVRVPPLVVHGYRNAGDADVRFLNCHAPGQGFADYLRRLRDGRAHEFDQEPPPADGGRPPAEASVGEEAVVVDRAGLRVALLADAEDIAIAEVRAGPGAPPAPAAHLHRRHVESLYVLEGELALTVAGRDVALDAGSWLTVAPGVPYAASRAGSGPVRFLSLHAPSCGFAGYLRALPDAGYDVALAARRADFDWHPARAER